MLCTESAEAKASGRGASDFDIEQTPLLCGHPPLVEWHGQPKRLAACWEALTLLLLGSVMWTQSGQEAALLKVPGSKEEQLLYRWKTTA